MAGHCFHQASSTLGKVGRKPGYMQIHQADPYHLHCSPTDTTYPTHGTTGTGLSSLCAWSGCEGSTGITFLRQGVVINDPAHEGSRGCFME